MQRRQKKQENFATVFFEGENNIRMNCLQMLPVYSRAECTGNSLFYKTNL